MQSILIVDDIAENLYFLEVLLKGNGFDVRTASNGAKALESARNIAPDLIISDILMPVMDGYVLCRECKADKRLKQIPFIFYTATFVEKKDEALALSLGADRFVIKPQEPEALMAIIHEVLSSSRSGEVQSSAEESLDERTLLMDYSEALFRKLEKKMAELDFANQKLQESEQLFRQFIVECPMPIAISDHAGNIELLNDLFTATFGYTPADIPTAESWWQLAYPDPQYRAEVSGLWQTALEKVLRDGGTVRPADEYLVTCKNGTVRIVEIYGVPITNRMLVVLNDITERRRAEIERTEMQIHMIQQDKMASIGQIAAGVAHEINNPIGFINSNLESLVKHTDKLGQYIGIIDDLAEHECSSSARDRLAAERSRLHIEIVTRDIGSILKDCFEGVERIITIVRDLKGFVHHDMQEMKPVDLNKSCDTIISIIWNEIKYVAELKKEYGDIPPVNCNSQQISQVLMNLMINAGHAIETKGNKFGEIIIRTWCDQNNAFIAVSDTGCGIAPESLDKIFTAFYTTKEVGKGTGLGLSISSEIIKRHGGDLSVDSVLGKGSTFTIRLPLQPAHCDDKEQQ